MTKPAPPGDDARVTRCMFCRDTKRVRIDLPRDAWIPMKDGTYEVLSGDTHECVRGVSQAIIKPCPMCTAPSPTADEARTVWFIVRDPGCYPQRKGPFTQQQVKPFLLELMEARPTSFIEIVTIHDGEIDVQDGPEALEQIDGRYAARARNNREQRRNALSRVPSEDK